MDNGTENVEARQDTTAEDIFSRCSKDILNPILTKTNSRGSSGAPSQPEDNDPIFRKQAAPSLMYVGSRWNGIPHNFDKNGNNRHIKIA
jgi:hypothetical protein